MATSRTYPSESSPLPVGFADVLHVPDFTALFAAETQSLVGDQLARVALSVLVYEQTGSAPATAATYAATLLPAVAGGYLLAWVGDRWSRRAVMIGCDLLRALCFVVMAICVNSLAAVVVLVVLAGAVGPAFQAAEVSYLANRLSADGFAVANTLRLTTSQISQVAGFALGGALVGLLGPAPTLVVDAGTYVLSALAIAFFARDSSPSHVDRPATTRPATTRPATTRPAVPFRGFLADPELRSLVAFGLLAGFFVVPEGLAVPFGASIGRGPVAVGALLAAIAAGGALGGLALVKLAPSDTRPALVPWLAIGCGVPLVVSGLWQGLWVAIVCWFVAGVLASYLIIVLTVVVSAIPDEQRARRSGVLGAALIGSQGAGIVVFGQATRFVSPGHAIAYAGLFGIAIASVLPRQSLRRVPAIAQS